MKDSFKSKLVSVLNNRNFLVYVSLLAFVVVVILVLKTFYFGKKIDHYEEFYMEVTKKEETEARYLQDKQVDLEVLKKSTAADLVNCISSPVDINNLPDNIKNVVNEINNYYNQNNNYFAFAYKDIFTGFTVSYNANQKIFTASTIKAPTDIYIYEMASKGKINLDEKLTYTGNYYNSGSGLLKDKSFNTEYSIKTLLEYSTVHSDNAAHNMLEDHFGRGNMYKFWNKLGADKIFISNNNWGILDASDALIYMSELYDFYSTNKEYGEPLMQNFINAYPKFIKGKNGYEVANKSGWSGSVVHDIAIIFADNPYIVVALSNLGEGGSTSYFNKANDLAYKLHTEYWNYKMQQCNIKLYEEKNN